MPRAKLGCRIAVEDEIGADLTISRSRLDRTREYRRRACQSRWLRIQYLVRCYGREMKRVSEVQ